jgi:hypothetical protein
MGEEKTKEERHLGGGGYTSQDVFCEQPLTNPLKRPPKDLQPLKSVFILF